MTLTAYEVFPVTKYPEHTYVSRIDNYEDRIVKCLKRGQIAFIHGMSRLGKTVLAKRIASEAHVIASENFQSATSFWEKVARELGIAESEVITEERSRSEGQNVNIVSRITTLLAELGANIEQSEESSATKSVSKQRQISITDKIRNALIIDNFHFIRRDVQIDILKSLKGIVDKPSASSFPIIIIATTSEPSYISDRLSDLGASYTPITIEPWTKKELAKIPQVGFPRLNARLTPLLLDILVREVNGVPVIMQAICLELALHTGLGEPAIGELLNISRDEVKLEEIYREAAYSSNRMGDFSKLVSHAVTKSGLAHKVWIEPIHNISQRSLISLHEAVIHALVDQFGKRFSLHQLETNLGKILSVNSDDRNELQPVLSDLDTVLSDLDTASQNLFHELISREPYSSSIDVPLIEWDPAQKRIAVSDPMFAFYVKWSGQLTNVVG